MGQLTARELGFRFSPDECRRIRELPDDVVLEIIMWFIWRRNPKFSLFDLVDECRETWDADDVEVTA